MCTTQCYTQAHTHIDHLVGDGGAFTPINAHCQHRPCVDVDGAAAAVVVQLNVVVGKFMLTRVKLITVRRGCTHKFYWLCALSLSRMAVALIFFKL